MGPEEDQLLSSASLALHQASVSPPAPASSRLTPGAAHAHHMHPSLDEHLLSHDGVSVFLGLALFNMCSKRESPLTSKTDKHPERLCDSTEVTQQLQDQSSASLSLCSKWLASNCGREGAAPGVKGHPFLSLSLGWGTRQLNREGTRGG